jgi:hypothetical protein
VNFSIVGEWYSDEGEIVIIAKEGFIEISHALILSRFLSLLCRLQYVWLMYLC